jgi:hypothetical protein
MQAPNKTFLGYAEISIQSVRFMLIQDRQGVEFDRSSQARGVNFRRLRYRDAEITPSPIVHDRGIQIYGEHINALNSPESLHTFVAKIPKDGLRRALLRYGYTLSEALAPNSQWFVDQGDGIWIPLRQYGRCDRVSPVRYHITLVAMGI